MPVSEEKKSESVRYPRCQADLCQKKNVRSRGVSENCPSTNNRYNLIYIYMTSNIFGCFTYWALAWQVLFKRKSTLHLPIFFLKRLLDDCACLKFSYKNSCCPSEYWIGIQTFSELWNIGFRLAPLDVTIAEDVIPVVNPRGSVIRLAFCIWRSCWKKQDNEMWELL